MAEHELRDLLLSTFDYVAGRIRDRLDGLTDDEYFWEPVPGCWTLRPAPGGGFVGDWAEPAPDPPPVTTIAWRLTHIIWVIGEHGLTPVAFHGGKADWHDPSVYPGSAADALGHFDRAAEVWRGELAAVSEDRLWQPMGPEAGPFADASSAAFVEHIHDELIHHGAEVALLRDLYRARPRARPRSDATT